MQKNVFLLFFRDFFRQFKNQGFFCKQNKKLFPQKHYLGGNLVGKTE